MMSSKSATSSSGLKLAENGLEDLSEAERTKLVKMCKFLTKDSDTAEDLAHSAVLKAMRYKFSGSCKRTSWLFLIAKHLFLNTARVKSRTFVEIGDVELADPAQSPLAQILRDERAEPVRKAVDALPKENQRVIHARFYDGMNLEETQKSLRITVSMTKMRQHRGCKLLRNSLTP